ncbi:MAG: glycosyltransferase [Candidatus Parcubacteria bacterium]|nr:glycosyltransferase [Candidatus Parcubacteria bacterium]
MFVGIFLFTKIMFTKTKISLLIPVLNGEKILPKTFARLEDFFRKRDYLARVVFIDDGSTDTTSYLLEEYQKQAAIPVSFIKNSANLGKGASIKRGMQEIESDTGLFAFTDVDLPYGLLILDDVIKIFIESPNVTMVIGNRNLATGQRQYSWYRLILKNIFRLFLPKLVRNFTDTQCGLKAFSRAFVEYFNLVITKNWCFDIELLLIAKRNKLIVSELPVRIEQIERWGGLSLNKDIFRVLFDLYTIHQNDKLQNYCIKHEKGLDFKYNV